MQTTQNTNQPLKVAIIGAGTKKGEDYFLELSKRPDVKIVACVVNNKVPILIQAAGVRLIDKGNVDELLKDVDFDVAVVSLPHNLHDPVTRKLLQRGKRIIKEKPLALTRETAEAYEKEITSKNLYPIFTTVQRGTHFVFQHAKSDLPFLGEPTSFTYNYTMNLSVPTSGWRRDKAIAGGGVVIDMGYHAIDQVIDFFGEPERVTSNLGYVYDEMREKELEDTAQITFHYKTFSGTINLSRHAEEKGECFCIEGTKGRMTISPRRYEFFATDGRRLTAIINAYQDTVIKDMFDHALHASPDTLMRQFRRNITVMKVIDAIYLQK